jgi:hypothetical protein
MRAFGEALLSWRFWRSVAAKTKESYQATVITTQAFGGCDHEPNVSSSGWLASPTLAF